ncbi:hypothetical protein [Ruegeria sp. HKCCA4633]|uniref:hypothetical protein n=1 Tax=Ruegeria sp. HKCCA4633 TaxID=2682983 RepID=UPI001489D9A3|nr:hypothetical protein [Ruegeria sp. HKCCA4633]
MFVEMQQFIQIGLQQFGDVMKLLAEHNLVELPQHCLVEHLATAVRLRWFHLDLGVFHVLDRKVELEVVFVDRVIEIVTPVGDDLQQQQVVLDVGRSSR